MVNSEKVYKSNLGDKSDIIVETISQETITKKEKEIEHMWNSIPQISRKYKMEREIPQNTYFKEYEVRSLKDNEIYRLRVLDLNKNTESDDRDNNKATIFDKEFIRFVQKYPGEVILADVERTQEFNVYIKKEGYSLQHKSLEGIKELDAEMMIKDILNDIYFLENKMNLGSFSLKLANICQSKESKRYYVDYREIHNDQAKVNEYGIPINQGPKSANGELEHYIYQLGLVLIELFQGNKELIDTYTKDSDEEIQKLTCKKLLNGLNCSEKMKNLIMRMIVKDPQNRIKLNQITKDIVMVESLESQISQQDFIHQNIIRYPNSVHGMVLRRVEDELIIMGTGTLIGPSIVLTSGNNIYDHAKNDCYQNLEFVPEVTEEAESPLGRASVKKYYVTDLFKSNSKKENFGILILEKPIGEQLGYLGLHLSINDDSLAIPENTKVRLTGYVNKKMDKQDKILIKQIQIKGEPKVIDPADNWITYDLEIG